MGIVAAALRSRFAAALAAPHTVDHYLDQVHPLLTVHAVRARVLAVTPETAVATTVTVRPNRAWRGHRPGQHVEFGIEVDGSRKLRVFTIAGATGRDLHLTIKAHPDGEVSRFVRDRLTPGTVAHLSQAGGAFVLPDPPPRRLLLVSGGSGSTPAMAILRDLAAREPAQHPDRVTFLHYARSRADELFSRELDTLADAGWAEIVRVYTREPDPGTPLAGRFDASHLRALGVDVSATAGYVCGPAGLIEVVEQAFAGAPGQLRSEYFKVPAITPDAAEATGTVTFSRSGRQAANTGAPLLVQAEAAGLTPAYGCRMGICNTCATTKDHGAVRHVITGEVSTATGEVVKPCTSVPLGDVSIAL